MKKSEIKSLLLTLMLILLSAALLYSMLAVFGAHNRSITVEPLPPKLMRSIELPGILQEDYESYPIDKIGNDEMRPDYMLTGKDAAVLAAKQIEDISGENAKGLYWQMEWIVSEGCWYATSVNTQSGEFVFGARIDAISGMIQQYIRFSWGIPVDYEQEDIDACVASALNIAEKYFNYDKKEFNIAQSYEDELNGNLPTNRITVNDGYADIIILLNDYNSGYDKVLSLRYEIGNRLLNSFQVETYN